MRKKNGRRKWYGTKPSLEPRNIRKLVTDHLPIPAITEGSHSGPRVILPHTDEIYGAIEDPNIREVVLLMASQTTKTTISFDAFVEHLLFGEGAAHYIAQTQESLENIIAEKFDPMLTAASPYIRNALLTFHGKHYITRKGGIKTKRGTHGAFISAESPKNLRSLSPVFAFIDELDLLKKGLDGTAMDVVRRGQTTHPRSKLLVGSTVTDPLRTEIVPAWEKTDQRQREIPCTECGFIQWPDWENMDTELCQMRCVECGEPINEAKAKARAVWTKLRPEITDSAGFRMNAITSPLISWRDLVRESERMTKAAFHRQMLVDPMHDEIKPPPDWTIWQSVRKPADQPPPGLTYDNLSWISIGADINDRHIDYLVTYHYLDGHIVDIVHRGVIPMSVDLSAFYTLAEKCGRWSRNGILPYVAIDGGYEMAQVVSAAAGPFAGWTSSFNGMSYFMIVRGKGPDSFGDPDVTGQFTINGTISGYTLATDSIKMQLYRAFERITDTQAEPTLYVSDNIREGHLREFTSEVLTDDPTKKSGQIWKLRSRHTPNHGLDCLDYAWVAHKIWEYQLSKRKD